MREWIYDDAGATGRRFVARIQFEGDEEINTREMANAISQVFICLAELGVGKTIHTPGEIPKWWKEGSDA